MSDQRLERSSMQENLLALYLRLNGYFVTNFIVHSSENGRINTQIDALAVRFPYNSEPERQVPNSSYLEPANDCIDLLVCEVKSQGRRIRFNDALIRSPEALQKILRWAGMFTDDEVVSVAQGLLIQLEPSSLLRGDIPTVRLPRGVRVRAALCSPERAARRDNQPWFIHGGEIFRFIWSCFRPETLRETCSTRYNFTAWGDQYYNLVRYFKDPNRDRPGNIHDLYAFLRI